jgi:hypothetical protein
VENQQTNQQRTVYLYVFTHPTFFLKMLLRGKTQSSSKTRDYNAPKAHTTHRDPHTIKKAIEKITATVSLSQQLLGTFDTRQSAAHVATNATHVGI